MVHFQQTNAQVPTNQAPTNQVPTNQATTNQVPTAKYFLNNLMIVAEYRRKVLKFKKFTFSKKIDV